MSFLPYFGVGGRYGTDAVSFRHSRISADLGLSNCLLMFTRVLEGWRFGGLRAYSLVRSPSLQPELLCGAGLERTKYLEGGKVADTLSQCGNSALPNHLSVIHSYHIVSAVASYIRN